MALQSIAVSRRYPKTAEAAIGDTMAEGYYMGRTENKYAIPAGTKQHFVIREESGTEVVLGHCGSLEKWLKTVDPGTWVVIIFDGKEKLGSKHLFAGKEAYKFKIYADPDKQYRNASVQPIATNPTTLAEAVEEEVDL
jgi:hypothetical protein